MESLDDPVIGAQRPRLLLEPAGVVATSGDEVRELAELTGLVLDPWQQFTVDVMTAERDDGKWAAFECGLIVPRQNGKGASTEAVELAGLFLFGEKLIVHSAHEFKTAKSAYIRLASLIQNTPDLHKRVRRYYNNNNDTSIHLKSGQEIRFITRTKGSARGLTGDRIIMDEAYELGPAQMAALLPTLSTIPNPQILYTSSAALTHSEQLHAARNRAKGQIKRDEQSRLAWMEWSIPEEAPKQDGFDRRDPKWWQMSNPSMGIRISEEYLTDECAAFDEQSFLRERLGVPDVLLSELGSIIDPDEWAACENTQSKLVGPVVFAIDVQPGSKLSAISVAGENQNGERHIEFVDSGMSRKGTGWVVDELVRLTTSHECRGIVVDPGSEAGGLVADIGEAFRDLDVPLILVSANDHASSVSTLLQSVPERRVVHVGQPEMLAAVSGAQLRPLRDASAFKRRDSSVDITPLVAATLALGAFISLEPEVPVVDYSAMFQII